MGGRDREGRRPANVIHDELVTFTLPSGGRGVALVPVIPDHAPPRVREGIARRRLAAVTGQCACGGTVDYDAARAGQVQVAELHHARLCPADTATLTDAIRRWSR